MRSSSDPWAVLALLIISHPRALSPPPCRPACQDVCARQPCDQCQHARAVLSGAKAAPAAPAPTTATGAAPRSFFVSPAASEISLAAVARHETRLFRRCPLVWKAAFCRHSDSYFRRDVPRRHPARANPREWRRHEAREATPSTVTSPRPYLIAFAFGAFLTIGNGSWKWTQSLGRNVDAAQRSLAGARACAKSSCGLAR